MLLRSSRVYKGDTNMDGERIDETGREEEIGVAGQGTGENAVKSNVSTGSPELGESSQTTGGTENLAVRPTNQPNETNSLNVNLIESMFARINQEIQNSMSSMEDRLQNNLNALESRVQENLGNVQTNLGKLENRMQENVQASLGSFELRIQANIGTLEGRLGTSLNELRGDIRNEITRLEGNVREVRDSMTEMRAQVETNLEHLQAEWGDRIDSRLRVFQTELNDKVTEVSGSFTAQLGVVNTQINEIQEQIQGVQTVAQTSENQARGRIQELEREVLLNNETNKEKMLSLEREIEKLTRKSSNNLESAGGEGSTSGVSSRAEAGSSDSQNNEGRSIPLAPVNENFGVAENVNCSMYNVNTDGSGNAFPRISQAMFHDVTLPSFSNGPNENPVLFLSQLENFFELKAIPERQKMLVVKSSLKGSVLGWYSLILHRDIQYSDFRQSFLNFFWDSARQGQVRSKLNFGRYDVRGRAEMSDYFIELAQQASLLNPPLGPKEFIDIAIQHFPQDVRNGLIIAKPSNFSDMVTLLKLLQGRKNAEREGESSGSPNGSNKRVQRRDVKAITTGGGAQSTRSSEFGATSFNNVPSYSDSQNNFRSSEHPSGAGDSRGQNRNENYRGANNGNSRRFNSGPRYRNWNNYGPDNRPPRVNYVRVFDDNYFDYDFRVNRPYWMNRNVSNGYHRRRGNRNNGNRRTFRGGNNRNAGTDRQNQNGGTAPPPAENQASVEHANRNQSERPDVPDQRAEVNRAIANPENSRGTQ